MDRYRDIINRIEDIPPVRAPDNFTDTVMRRVHAGGEKRVTVTVREYLAHHGVFGAMRAVIARNMQGTDCPLSFFVTGAFYMIMGIVLMIGLREIGGDDTITQLMRFQTQMTLVSSVLLIALGVMMASDGPASVRVGKFGLLAYVCLVIVNSLVLQAAFHVAIADIFTVIFSGTGVIMGMYLAVKIDHYQKRTVRGGV